MKKIMPFALIVVVFAVQAMAQVAQQESIILSIASCELKSSLVSEYVSPFGKLVYDKPAVQSEAVIWFKVKDVPGMLYLDVWHSSGFQGTMNSDSGDEIDYSVGWKGEIFQGINLSVWGKYLDYVPLGRATKNSDQIWLSAELDRKFQISADQAITPFWRMEIPFSAYNVSNGFCGLRSYLGVRHTWEFYPNLSINQKVNLILDDGAKGLNPGVLGDYKVSLSWQATKWLAVEPFSVRVVGPLHSLGDGRETQIVYGCGLSIKF